MEESEEFLENKIAEAAARARREGRADVADYLALRAANDELRRAASRLLFAHALRIAHERIGRGSRLDIENVDPHRFEMNKSFAVGSLLRFRAGLRTLTVEAGWARTPSDGFMRGGALAYARLTHFGFPRHNAELLLLPVGDAAPEWFLRHAERPATERFDPLRLNAHFDVLLG